MKVSMIISQSTGFSGGGSLATLAARLFARWPGLPRRTVLYGPKALIRGCVAFVTQKESRKHLAGGVNLDQQTLRWYRKIQSFLSRRYEQLGINKCFGQLDDHGDTESCGVVNMRPRARCSQC
jgi:hypothetical protein